MNYYFHVSSAGVAQEGLHITTDLTWEYLKQEDGSASTPVPTFTEIAGGWYYFTVVYGAGAWDDTDGIFGVIDCDGAVAQGFADVDRYIPVAVTKRGLALESLTIDLTDETQTNADLFWEEPFEDHSGVDASVAEYLLQVPNRGTGPSIHTITINTTDGDPIEGAACWVKSSVGGATVSSTVYTNSSGQVVFWLPGAGTYQLYVQGGGYDYSASLPVALDLAASSQTANIGVAYTTPSVGSGGSASYSTLSFLYRMLQDIRLMTDEPASDEKYSDADLIRFIEQEYVILLQEIQRNANTQIVAKYEFTVVADTLVYVLPATCGKVLSISTEGDYGYKVFWDSRSHLSEYGQGLAIEGNTVRFQAGTVSTGTEMVVYYLPSGCARLFDAEAASLDTTNQLYVTASQANAGLGTIDLRPNAYAGSMLRTLPNDDNKGEQQRIISESSSSEGTVTFTVESAFSPALAATTHFEVGPPFSRTFDSVVATAVALKVVGLESNSERHKILLSQYKIQRRALVLGATNKDGMKGPIMHRDSPRIARKRGRVR